MHPIDRRSILKYSAAAVAAVTGLPQLAHAQGGPLKIGLITPLSGPQEFIGSYVKNGAEIAVEQINKAGGINVNGEKVTFKLVSLDDRYLPNETASNVKRLTGQGIEQDLARDRLRIGLRANGDGILGPVRRRSRLRSHRPRSARRSGPRQDCRRRA